MYLRAQNNDAIVDTDKCTSIVIADGGKIYTNLHDGNSLCIGSYSGQDRAEEVLEELFALLECTSKYDMPVV